MKLHLFVFVDVVMLDLIKVYREKTLLLNILSNQNAEMALISRLTPDHNLAIPSHRVARHSPAAALFHEPPTAPVDYVSPCSLPDQP